MARKYLGSLPLLSLLIYKHFQEVETQTNILILVLVWMLKVVMLVCEGGKPSAEIVSQILLVCQTSQNHSVIP